MANRWTEEQKKAIEIEGTNVIVSAGAGSGKTAVLSERVLRKVKENTHINEMLILTFTKMAAKEMKDRIKKKLIENKLYDEVELLDGAYITTFDSYSLSVVKKYHHILNIDSNIQISDPVLLEIIKRDLLQEILDSYYKSENEDFKNFVYKFSLKDDNDLVDLIIKLSNKLDLKYDRKFFLESYIEKYYSDFEINKLINEYIETVFKEFENFKDLVYKLQIELEDKKLTTLNLKIGTFLNSKTYEEIYEGLKKLELPRSNGYSDEAKIINESLKASRDELRKLCVYENKALMYKELKETYNDTKILVEILLKLDSNNTEYKRKNNLYDFNDISHLAIKLVMENETVKDEVKNTFKEILIDEYQDTSDNQELFISLISNNNVYMVGDIKQSIYRFRNANPYIFKNKYDLYSNQSMGIKIDLNKNFRSREEVLSNINMLFENIMDNEIGGADYRKSHKAIFGNISYNEEGETTQNNNLEIYTYTKNKDIKDVEQEAFIIAEDIKNKVDSNYKIFDKDSKIIRNATYDDFVILLDKKKNFDLYKKIFEYLKIPLTIYKEEKINNTDDFLIIHNLFKLVLKVYENDFTTDFKYAFLSLSRSFLFNYDDNEIFKIFKEDLFLKTDIVKIAFEIKDEIDILPLKDIFRLILDKYKYFDKLLTVTDIDKCEKCIEYLESLIDSLKNSDINDFMYYLDNVISKDYDIKYDNSVEINNSVKIMSIHKSKGLEFPICYFADLQNKFNMKDQKEKVIFSNKYGIILPNIEEESKDTIKKILYKNFDTIEEVSERIRLFYVALTRCKEKIIILAPEVEDDKSSYQEIVDMSKRKKYISFYSILKSIWYKLDEYIVNKEIKGYSKNYLYKPKEKEINLLDANEIFVEEVNVEKEKIKKEHFSKESNKFISKEEQDLLKFGSMVHQILENIDFMNPNLENIDNKFVKDKIRKFINSSIIKNNLDSTFYKEYEFIYQKDSESLHGIIDLMIENKEEIIIVDYKLKNIDDSSYIKQLRGYKDYISLLKNKKITLYLYSILDETFKIVY